MKQQFEQCTVVEYTNDNRQCLFPRGHRGSHYCGPWPTDRHGEPLEDGYPVLVQHGHKIGWYIGIRHTGGAPAAYVSGDDWEYWLPIGEDGSVSVEVMVL